MHETTNFQYVGYLGDFLNTYNSIDELTESFQSTKQNYENAQKLLEEYENTFSVRNCIMGFLLLFIIFLLVTSIPVFLQIVNPLLWLCFCAISSCVIIFLSRFMYNQKVLPTHRTTLQYELSRFQDTFEKVYNDLIAQRSNLHNMSEGIDEQCTYPLSIYIMREAAKEGECSNIPQGIRYFNSRYKTLETATDDFSCTLKESIDEEKQASDKRREFLEALDDIARSLYN